MEGGPSFGRPRQHHASQGKRTHGQMEAGHGRSASPLFVRQDSSSDDRATPPPPRYNPHLALPPIQGRFAGDGLDHRRPISSTRSVANIIDLTDDDDSMASTYATPQPEPAAPPPRPQRLPRFSREIIDLSVDTSPPEPRHHDLPRPQAPYARQPAQHNAPAVRSSPEVQFVSERPRSPRPRLQDRLPTPYEQTHGQAHAQARPLLDLTVDLDDDVVHVRTEGRAGINLQGPHGRQNDLGMGRIVDFMRRNAMGARAQWPDIRHIFQMARHPWEDEDEDEDEAAFALHTARRTANLPGGMDYTTLGFGVGLDFGDDTPPRLPTPKYSPPPDPGPGFTRSPQEDGELICPNCNDELGIGETDEKKQVWVIKACGHVYCGQCMLNRKSKNKGKARVTDPAVPPSFSSCQVPDCTKKATHKTQVMQIFL